MSVRCHGNLTRSDEIPWGSYVNLDISYILHNVKDLGILHNCLSMLCSIELESECRLLLVFIQIALALHVARGCNECHYVYLIV